MAENASIATSHVVVPSESPHTHTVILLHGRGSNGAEFAKELFEARTSHNLTLQEHFPTWKWIFPTSRTGFSTVFQEEMNEWFDIYSLTNPDKRQDLQVDGLKESICTLRNLITSEAQHIPTHRLILGGISQGCAVGLHALITTPYRLGAFVGFCGWLPFQAQLETLELLPDFIQEDKEAQEDREAQEDKEAQIATFYQSILSLKISNDKAAAKSGSFDTPVFLCHAKDDDVVDIDLGRLACMTLRRLHLHVSWVEYDTGGHWIKEPDGFDDVVNFLEQSTYSRRTK